MKEGCRGGKSTEERKWKKRMKIFKNLEGTFYYTQERNTLRWYSAKEWRKEIVQEPVGTMLAEGSSKMAIEEVEDVLPSELHEVICQFYLEAV